MLTDDQINAALAEKAEGRVWVHRSQNRLLVTADAEEFLLRRGAERGRDPELEDRPTWPEYLTDPVASQALKAAMQAKGWLVSIEDRLELSVRDGVVKEIGTRYVNARLRIPGSPRSVTAEDPSELRAIALAACRALGIRGV